MPGSRISLRIQSFLRLRSPAEFAFRIRQEAASLWLYIRKPALPLALPRATPRLLPDPGPIVERLRGAPFQLEIISVADQVLRHELPVMGATLSAGPGIQWRWDYSSPAGPGDLRYFRRVPYLDPAIVGDYRFIWEFNRHQHLVATMQAFLFTGDSRYAEEVWAQLESWWEQNPFAEGINWTSALEVAFRALSWIWIDHFGRDFMPEDFRARFLTELYRHARFLEYNLSVYFSPNTHLLGESVVLHAIGAIFPHFPGAARWRKLGGRTAVSQMEVQVRDDGGYFENATFYQLYALDFFLLHSLLADTPPEYRDKLQKMADYTAALSGAQGINPFIGDDDGGRVFHPFGERATFGRASLSTCGVLFNRPDWIFSREEISRQAAWWLGERAFDAEPGVQAEPRSRIFPLTGTAVLETLNTCAIVDMGAFGWGSGGHSHCDTLSLTLTHNSEEILIDPGTFTYVLEPWRDRFRSSAAHNTLRIDHLDQAIPRKAFSWFEKPACEIVDTQFGTELDFLVAECRYGGVVHRRRILFLKASALFFILDEAEAPNGDSASDYLAEQFWHPGAGAVGESSHCFRLGSNSLLILSGNSQPEISESGEYGWRSKCLSQKEPAPVIKASVNEPVPLYLAAVLDLRPDAAPVSRVVRIHPVVRIQPDGEPVTVIVSYLVGNRTSKVRFGIGRSTFFQPFE